MAPRPDAALQDPARLEALRRAALLDTPAEESYDQLTRLACAVLNAPVALISLVDARRQFFKSCVGLGEPWCSARESPLTHSFCQHVVASGRALVIDDARTHPLVSNNMAIRDMGVAAYAGVPLRVPGGHVIGTLCVIDRMPRHWNPTELKLLSHLGSCVLTRIEIGMALGEVRRGAAESERRALELEASERRISDILECTLDAVIVMDASGRIELWNTRSAEIFGWSEADVVGRLLEDIVIPPRYRDAHRAGLAQFLATGSSRILGRRVTMEGLHRDGHEIPIELTVAAIRRGSAGPWSFSAFVRDLTDQRRAEAALRQAVERSELVARATNDAVWDWDLVVDRLDWNEAFETLFGYRRSEIEPGVESWYSRLHPEDHERVRAGIRARIEDGSLTWSDEYRFRRADGSYVEVFDRGFVIRDAAGSPVRMVGAMMDITEKRQAGKSEQAAYRIARAVTAGAGLPELFREIHETIVGLMPASNFYIALFDPVQQVLTFPYFVDEHDRPPAARPLRRGLTDYVFRTGETLLATPEVYRDLEERGDVELMGGPSLDWLGVPLRTRAGTIGVLAVQSYSEGIRYGKRETSILEFVSGQVALAIERVRIDEQLRDSEWKYRMIFEGSPEAMWVIDRDSLRILAVNDASIRRYGYTRAEFLGMSVRDLWPPEDRARQDAVIAERMGGLQDYAGLRHRRKDGSTLDVEVTADSIMLGGHPARLVLARDVSNRKLLEDQLRQSQKMEAIGQLAGGFAHDFNNVLTAILASAGMLEVAMPEDAPEREDLGFIVRAASSGAELTRKLLAFGRRQQLEVRSVALGQLVAEFVRLVRRVLPERIEISTRLEAGDLLVRADPGAADQILMNLVTNARDAISGVGRIEISLARRDIEQERSASADRMPKGSYVELSVRDTGSGMDPETQRRLFEPFFTTKEVGSGTGLGMAMVYGLMRQQNGFVEVTSEPGRGTLVALYFPPAPAGAGEVPGEAARVPVRGGTETILLAEDNAAVREVAARVLQHAGYRVVTAANGQEALERVASGGIRPDLVVSDLMMPRLSGPEFLRELRAAGIPVKVIFTSGYAPPDVQEQMSVIPGVPFLIKPWTSADLLRMVRAVLDS